MATLVLKGHAISAFTPLRRSVSSERRLLSCSIAEFHMRWFTGVGCSRHRSRNGYEGSGRPPTASRQRPPQRRADGASRQPDALSCDLPAREAISCCYDALHHTGIASVMPGFADHDKFTFGPLPGEAPRDDQGAAEVPPPMYQNAGYPPQTVHLASGLPHQGGSRRRISRGGLRRKERERCRCLHLTHAQ